MIYVRDSLAEEHNMAELQAALGAGLEIGPENDIFALAVSLAARSETERPRIFITCGGEDYLFDSNERLHARLDELNLAHRYLSWPGTHEWGFWDESLQMALDFFFAPKPEAVQASAA
jgi:S-formylglutathione hydrolase FrmB